MHDRRLRTPISLLYLLIAFLCLVTPVTAQQNSGEQVVHIVQPGENLYRISLRYGVSMETIAQANGITDMTRIYAGQQLIIPGLSNPSSGISVENPLIAGTPIIHVVQPGENLTMIAQRYGVTVEQILEANNIPNPNRIARGQELQIWTPQSVIDGVDTQQDAALGAVPGEQPQVVAAPTNSIVHVVQPGERLVDIALRYGVSWPAIAQANNLANPNQIYAGQELVIPDPGTVADLGIVAPVVTGPPAVVTVGRSIVVDLSDSRIYAYEDGRLVRNVLVSTGLPATPTVQGDYTIYSRIEAQTMSGPGYYLPNVQWVQYFYQGYAIHGTYWHSNWGQPMSHGCVNLPNDEAYWFYQWAAIGTPVHVQA